MMSLRDEEEQTRRLLAPTPEHLASVKVFPLIPSIKRDVTVSIVCVISSECTLIVRTRQTNIGTWQVRFGINTSRIDHNLILFLIADSALSWEYVFQYIRGVPVYW